MAERTFTRSELGADWPFTVESVVVTNLRGALIVQSGGVHYALNGWAIRLGLEQPFPIWAIDETLKPVVDDDGVAHPWYRSMDALLRLALEDRSPPTFTPHIP